MRQNKPIKVWIAVLKGSITPLIIFSVAFAMFWFARRYGVDYKRYYLDKVFTVFFVFIIVYWVSKIAITLFDWYALNVAAKTRTTLDDKFIPLFKRVTATVIWAVGIIILLSRFGININALVATLGVSSLAIALAAQDTIANIIAGFLIMIDRPFTVGDDIKLPSGERVKVLDIGIRRSKFIAEDKAIIIMPNLQLSKNKIVNYTHGRGYGSNV